MKFTQIPARDGTAHGNIKRSNMWPNCSYFTNWTSLDDSITWQVDVAAPGNFKVKVADIGEIELNAGKALMRLMALEKPGNTVMDFRLMLFERVE